MRWCKPVYADNVHATLGKLVERRRSHRSQSNDRNIMDLHVIPPKVSGYQ